MPMIPLGPALFDNARFLAPTPIRSVAFVGGDRIAALADGAVTLFDACSGALLSTMPCGDRYYELQAIQGGFALVSDDGALAGFALGDGHAARPTFEMSVELGYDPWHLPAILLRDDELLVAVSDRLERRHLTMDEVTTLDGPLEGTENAPAFSADGDRVAWLGAEGIAVVDTATGEVTLRIACQAQPFAMIAFVGDGRLVVAQCLPHTVEVAVFSTVTAQIERTWTIPCDVRQDMRQLRVHGDRVLVTTTDLIACIAPDEDEPVWVEWRVWTGFDPHPTLPWIAVADGHRISRRCIETGALLERGPALAAPDIAPTHPVTGITRVPGGVLLLQRPLATVVCDKVVRHCQVWSMCQDGGRVYLSDKNGELQTVDDRGFAPLGKFMRSGQEFEASVAGNLVVFVDQAAFNRIAIATLRGEVLRRFGEPADSGTAHFLGTERVIVSTVKRGATPQGALALHDIHGAVIWRRPLDPLEPTLRVVGADPWGRAFLVRQAEWIRVVDCDGIVIHSLPAPNGPPKGDVIAFAFLPDDLVVAAQDGVAHRIRLDDWTCSELGRFGTPPTALHLDATGRGFVAFGCRAVHEVDLAAHLGRSEPVAPGFPTEAIRVAEGEELVRLIEEAPWDSFDADAHLPAVALALERAERAGGIGAAHRVAIDRLRRGGARLVHTWHHASPVTAVAVSPCGRWLATGSRCGHDYDRGGHVQVWDAAAARVVNVIPVQGGVGEVGEDALGPYLAWSPDGRMLIAAFNRNGVGTFEPFGDGDLPRTAAYTTDGGEAPAFACSSAGDLVAIASWGEHSAPVALVETSVGLQTREEARWPTAVGFEDLEDPPSGLRFTPDDRLLLAADGVQAFAIDLNADEVRYVVDATGPVDWSPCGRWLAHGGTELVLRDAWTGEPVDIEQIEGRPCAVLWGGPAERPRLAVSTDGTWTVFEDGRVVCRFVAPPVYTSEQVALSSDGVLLAIVTGPAEVAVWRVGAEPVRVGVVTVADVVRGLRFGPDALYVIGEATIEVCAPTGARRATLQVRDPSELLETTPPGELSAPSEPNAAFPVQSASGYTWALLLEDGVVACLSEAVDHLDEALAFVVDRRHPLPARWGIAAVRPLELEPTPSKAALPTTADATIEDLAALLDDPGGAADRAAAFLPAWFEGLRLLQEGHLDQAQEFANKLTLQEGPVYLRAAASLGHFDHALSVAARLARLKGLGAWWSPAFVDAFLAAGRHDQLLNWFDGLEVQAPPEAIDGVLDELARRGEAARVDERRLAEAHASASPYRIVTLMRQLSMTQPAAVLVDLLRVLVTRWTVSPLPRSDAPWVMERLAESLTRVGARATLETLREGFPTQADHLGMLRGIVRGARPGDDGPSALDEALSIARGLDSPRSRSEELAALAQALWSIDREGGSVLFDEARAAVVKLTGVERALALDHVARAALEVDAIDCAFRAWRSQSALGRRDNAAPLVKYLATAGRIDALLFVLRQLPKDAAFLVRYTATEHLPIIEDVLRLTTFAFVSRASTT